MSEGSRFSVILTEPEQRQTMVVAKALAAIRKTPVQDQVTAAKNGWGVLAEYLSPEEAQKLVESLKRAGLESKAVPSLASIPDAQPLIRWDP